MSDLQELVEREAADKDLIPTVVPVDARVSFGAMTSDLLALASRASSVAATTKEVIPGTGMVLVEAFSATTETVAYIRVSASDGDQWISVLSQAAVRVLVPGAVLLPAKKFLEVMKAAPGGATKIDVIGDSASIRSDRVVWTLSSPAGERLSVTPVQEDIKTFPVAAGGLRRAIRGCLLAMSPTNARPAMMQIHIADSKATATDGSRLHRLEIIGLDPFLTIDLPMKMARQVVEMLDSVAGDEIVQIGGNGQRVVVSVSSSRLIGQRIMLPFPEVENLLLKAAYANQDSLTVRREALLSAIKRVRINADQDYLAIHLSTIPTRDGGWDLLVRSNDSRQNSAQEQIPAQWSDSKGREVHVNHKHLTDLLSSLEDEFTVFKLGTDLKTSRKPLFVVDEEFQGVITQVT